MSRYRSYDGGDPLAPPVDLAEALDAIGQEVMAGYSPEGAMREFLRRGGRDQTGLDDLARRLAERRQDILQRHDLDGTMREVQQLLEQGRHGRARPAGAGRHHGRRRPRLPRGPARQPPHVDRVGGHASCPPTTGRAATPARRTSRSRTCWGVSCSTSASPA